MVKIRHTTIFSNWNHTTHFCDLCFTSYEIKNFDAIWQPYWIDEEWSYMTDFHLIVFLDNQNLGIDTKIGVLSGTVSKLLNICFFTAIMLIKANQGNYEKCSIVISRHPAVSNKWGLMQLFCNRSPGYLSFPCSACAIKASKFKSLIIFGRYIGFMLSRNSHTWLIFIQSSTLTIKD